MSEPERFKCGSCDEWHDGPPLGYSAAMPEYWTDEIAEEGRGELGEEQCIIDDTFFIRGQLQIPVEGSDEPFEWGVWVSVSEASFDRMSELWETDGRESEPPSFGWLATDLPYEPSTLDLKAHVWTQPVGERPTIELEPTDHPLSVEQRFGITRRRVEELAEELLHGD